MQAMCVALELQIPTGTIGVGIEAEQELCRFLKKEAAISKAFVPW